METCSVFSGRLVIEGETYRTVSQQMGFSFSWTLQVPFLFYSRESCSVVRSLQGCLRIMLLARYICLISIPFGRGETVRILEGWKSGEVKVCGYGPDCWMPPVNELGHVVVVNIEENKGCNTGRIRLQVKEFADEDTSCRT
jgi:hypothetical protein